jgi:hypothetical protein
VFDRRVAADDLIWKRLCTDKFRASQGCKPPSWKEFYRCCELM